MKSLLTIPVLILITGCTLSFQNICTHGVASDLVDDTQSASPTVSTELKLPTLPIP